MRKHHLVITAVLNVFLAPAAFGQPAPPPSGSVVIFERKNFTGRSQTLTNGNNALTGFSPESIRVPRGVLAYLYEFADAGGGFGISVDLLEDQRDLSRFRMSRVSLIAVSASTRPGFSWARGRQVNGQFVPGRWERSRAGGNPVNTVAVASPPLPGHLPTAPTSIRQQGATWTITTLGPQSVVDDVRWRSASATDGVIGSDFRGAQEIGSAAFERASNNFAIPDWFDFWFPNKQANDHRSIVYFKRTLAGVITDKLTKNFSGQVRSTDGTVRTISGTYELSDVPNVSDIKGTFQDFDLNIDVQPFGDYQYLIKDSHAPERSTIKFLKDLVDSDHDPCTDPFFMVKAEVDARDSAKQSIVRSLLPRIGKPVAAYGPWVFDVGHCSHPEIHPAEEIWWTDRTPNGEVYHLNVFADSSGRFWFRSQMDGDRKLHPWGAPPITGLFAIAFEVPIGTPSAVTTGGQRFDVASVDSLNVARVPDGDTAHDLVLGGTTLVSFVPHGDAFKVSYENVGLKPGSSNVVRGFLVIETTVGRVTQIATRATVNTGNQTVVVRVPPGSDPDKVDQQVERAAFHKEAGHFVFTVTRSDLGRGLAVRFQGTEEGIGGPADPRARGRPAPARVRDRPAHRAEVPGRPQLPHRLPLPDAVPARGRRPPRRPLGGKAGTAPAAVLPPDARRPQAARQRTIDLAGLLRRDRSRRRIPRDMSWRADVVRAFARHGRIVDDTVVEELTQHADAAYEAARGDGMSAADAERTTRASRAAAVFPMGTSADRSRSCS
jgi:hypothetical protein